jgi:hypothetical protein
VSHTKKNKEQCTISAYEDLLYPSTSLQGEQLTIASWLSAGTIRVAAVAASAPRALVATERRSLGTGVSYSASQPLHYSTPFVGNGSCHRRRTRRILGYESQPMRSDSAVARRATTTYGQGRVGATVQHREMSESTIGKSRAEVHIGQLYITSSEYHRPAVGRGGYRLG